MASSTVPRVAALLVALLPATAHAYVLSGQSWSGAKANFAYRVPGKPAAYSAALKSAMSDWTKATAFTYLPLNRAGNPCNSNGLSGVKFATLACGKAFGSTTLAVTISTFIGQRYIHAGTVFNANKAFSIYNGALKSGSTDFRRVAVHELGHGLGLDHETQPGVKAIMRPFVSSTMHPQADDIAGVNALYAGQ